MDKSLENKRQAVEPYEPFCLVSVTFLYRFSWIGFFYVAAIIPTALLLLRQALDFTYREELLMNSFSDYVEHARTWVEEVPVPEKADEAVKEEIVEHIADSIRQTAAAGSHFSGMLTPEEDEIMREIIREFMK